MKAKKLKPYEVVLTKSIITIKISTIMATDKDEAIDKGLLLFMAEYQLTDLGNWTANANIVNNGKITSRKHQAKF